MNQNVRFRTLPSWLSSREHYHPRRDHSLYIDKTILAVIGVLARIRSTRSSVGVLGTVHPVLKIIGTVLLLLLVSMTRSVLFIELAAATVLFALSSLAPRAAVRALSVSIIAALFAFVITAPSILQGMCATDGATGGGHGWPMPPRGNGYLLAVKVGLSAAMVNVLAFTTTWHRMTGALKMFFVSDVFILIFDIAMRYIYLLGEFSLDMLYALKLRSVGRNVRKHRSLVQMLGSLFLKSKDMAEAMYGAMECRGFSGQYKRVRVKHNIGADLIYSTLHLVLIAAFLLLR
ncbi:MAG: energy-coupling factor transporter transmembrane component T [Spirochaetota bacterium]